MTTENEHWKQAKQKISPISLMPIWYFQFKNIDIVSI